jgi:hypothetical protein
MAVNNVPQTSRAVVKVQTGLNAAGNPVYRLCNFRNLKVDALDADVYAAAQGLGGLQTYPVATISRINEGNLISQ